MDLKQLLIAPLLRPQVVHRLPGRLRVHLPALRRLPDSHLPLLEVIEGVLTVPVEILSARACSTTGNVLLIYNVEAVDEEELVGYVHGISRMLANHWKSLAALPPGELVARKGQWIIAVKAAIRYRLELDENIKVSV